LDYMNIIMLPPSQMLKQFICVPKNNKQ
jgi:hypothetical protein